MSASTSTTSWQKQQKDRAQSKKVTKPDIPGDYAGHDIPPNPLESFTGTTASLSPLVWPISAATLLLLIIVCVNGLNKR